MARPRTKPVRYPSLQALGANIEAVRKYMGLTQKEFAELIGVSWGSVSSWERSQKMPDIKYIMTICYKCGVSADDLLGVPRKWVKIK